MLRKFFTALGICPAKVIKMVIGRVMMKIVVGLLVAPLLAFSALPVAKGIKGNRLEEGGRRTTGPKRSQGPSRSGVSKAATKMAATPPNSATKAKIPFEQAVQAMWSVKNRGDPALIGLGDPQCSHCGGVFKTVEELFGHVNSDHSDRVVGLRDPSTWTMAKAISEQGEEGVDLIDQSDCFKTDCPEYKTALHKRRTSKQKHLRRPSKLKVGRPTQRRLIGQLLKPSSSSQSPERRLTDQSPGLGSSSSLLAPGRTFSKPAPHAAAAVSTKPPQYENNPFASKRKTASETTSLDWSRSDFFLGSAVDVL